MEAPGGKSGAWGALVQVKGGPLWTVRCPWPRTQQSVATTSATQGPGPRLGL